MSYARWGSKCDDECKDCPGSDVYVFFNSGGFYECCGCRLARPDPMVNTAEEMRAHLREHVKAGHHVDRRLLDVAVWDE